MTFSFKQPLLNVQQLKLFQVQRLERNMKFGEMISWGLIFSYLLFLGQDYQNYTMGKWSINTSFKYAFLLHAASILVGFLFLFWKKLIAQKLSFRLRLNLSLSFTGMNLLLASLITINDQFI